MDPITNVAELQAAIDTYFTTPRVPRVTGAETNTILRAMVQLLTGTGLNPEAQLIHNYLSALPGYGPGRVLLSDFTWASFYQTYPQLAAPAAFTFGAPASTSVNVSWSAVVHATNYLLQRALNDQFSDAVTLYTGAGTTFPANGLLPGVTYYFRVKAIAANYQDSAFLTGSATTAAAVAGQTVHINLANTGHVATEASWVNLLLDDWTNDANGWHSGTSPVVDNISGTPSGWALKFSSSGGGLGSGEVTLHGTAAPDFPDDVTGYKWFNMDTSPYYSMDIYLLGLTPGNVYAIKTVHFDSASLNIDMKWASTDESGDQGGDSGATPLELTFVNIPADSGGSIHGQLFAADGGQAAINGISITETAVITRFANMVMAPYNGTVLNGWNSLSNTVLDIAIPLLAINGSALEWEVTVASTGDLNFIQIGNTHFNDDFPARICQQQWYGETLGSITLTVAGLDPAKNYTIKTCHGDDGGSGAWTVSVTCNASPAQSGSPVNNTFFLEFDNIAPDAGGNIVITVSSTDNTPIINALIVKEN